MQAQGITLTEKQAQIYLGRFGSSMLDAGWALANGRDKLTEEFLSSFSSEYKYKDNSGKQHGYFTATNREYLDNKINLKPLFQSYGKDKLTQDYIKNIHKQNPNALADYNRGIKQGYIDSGKDAGKDPATIGKGILSIPGYIIKSVSSNELGPLDDPQMKSYYESLLRLQGRDYEAGRINEYDWATTQRLMWYQLPLMEAAGKLPPAVSSLYKDFKAGRITEAQLAARIKEQTIQNNFYRDGNTQINWTTGKSDDININFATHWEKHKHEFPNLNSAYDYSRYIENFVKSPPPQTLTKVRANGDRLYYQPQNNIFISIDKTGTPKTMFKPSKSIQYWNKQK
ncbi:hypothetical protein [Paralysiella testudinis]|uniref:Uncharacterized protein n=1 Tax=Paralysiella testudinis TaxID=2809020 RepID=A0A892ZFI1_9NEIS|nr:hypothetical protein [Paralysiella testudinis]QRQ82195.1 hypothetical protein JQU52_01820 [Paralysiella testudinis]